MASRFIFFLFLFVFYFINIPTNAQTVVFDIENALPDNPQTEPLQLSCGGEWLNLKIGDHYNQSAKIDQTIGCNAMWLRWLATWDAYDPVKYKGYRNVYWLAKKDGFYRSWDNSAWKHVVDWYTE